MERVTAPPAVPRKRQKRAFSVMRGRVLSGGEPTLATWLESLWQVEDDEGRYLTHGFHPYAARLHPRVARESVARLSEPGGIVLDPFCGSGTVLIEARVAGRRGLGVDASPLAVHLSRVKTDPLDAASRDRLRQTANEIAEESSEVARKRQRPTAIPAWARENDVVFPPHVFLELLGLRGPVLDAFPGEPRLSSALRLSFSSILGKFSEGEKRIARGLPSKFFARRVDELAGALETLEQAIREQTRTGITDHRPSIKEGDACKLGRAVRKQDIDLVVTSPPYAGTYDYEDREAFRYPWLDLPRSDFKQRQIGQRGAGLGAEPRAWLRSRNAFMSEIARALRHGGHALLAIGDGVVGDQAEDALKNTAETGMILGLRPVAWASQEREIRDRRVQEIYGRRVRLEHLLLLRRD